MSTGSGLDPERFEEYKLFEKHSQLFKESLDRFEPKAFAVSSVRWTDSPMAAAL